MKRILLVILLNGAVFTTLWHYQPPEAVLTTPPYLHDYQSISYERRSDRSLSNVLIIKGKDAFNRHVVGNKKPVAMLVHAATHDDAAESAKMRAGFLEAADAFKDRVVFVTINCEPGSENQFIISFIMQVERLQTLSLPAIVFIEQGGVAVTLGSPGIMQGYCNKENIESFIRSKFFAQARRKGAARKVAMTAARVDGKR